MVEIDSRKAALIAEIEISRGEMRNALRRCEANLDPGVVLRRCVRKAPAWWLSGAALVGIALSQVVRFGVRAPLEASPKGRSEDWGGPGEFFSRAKKSRGKVWMASLFRMAFDLFKPLIAGWVTEKLSSLAGAKVASSVAASKLGFFTESGRKAPDPSRPETERRSP
jgi:hypothetical protein